jgi:hypothetical protein
MTSGNMIDFVNEHIVYRFGTPQTITTDQGSQFTSREFEEYENSLGDQTIKLISLLCSSEWTDRGNEQGHHQIDQTQD